VSFGLPQLNNFRKSRVSDVSARIRARMFVSVSVSASWNASYTRRNTEMWSRFSTGTIDDLIAHNSVSTRKLCSSDFAPDAAHGESLSTYARFGSPICQAIMCIHDVIHKTGSTQHALQRHQRKSASKHGRRQHAPKIGKSAHD